jgi:hypothetical protein
MSVPRDISDTASAAIRSGYRWELDRAIRTNSHLRVFFSTAVLIYCGFGPGLLIRFPVSVGGVSLETVSQFYAFRPVIFSLIFVSLACVLAALARRGLLLFEQALEEDLKDDPCPGSCRRYVENLKPSAFPFVLSGNMMVDTAILFVSLVAYVFWVILLVQTIPLGMGTYQVVGVVLGSYGLFGGIIVMGFVWAGLVRRGRKLIDSLPEPDRPA